MGKLHTVFFPLMAHGHMLPILDMAKLFSSQGVKTTIITTPLNALVFTKPIERFKQLGFEISIHILKFPSIEVGLPEGYENLDQITSDQTQIPKFMKAITMFEEPLEQFLQECRPDCLVADMFFPWATDVAAKFDIPRLVYYGTSFFAMCATDTMAQYKPFKNVSSDSELFVIPHLPHEIKLTRLQVNPYYRQEIETDMTKLQNQIKNSEQNSYGVIANTFYALEPDYVDHFRNVLGRKAWHIGPLSLCNREIEDKAERGKKAAIDEHECMKWLDSKKPNSVIFICFGSMAKFTDSQLYEIAMGLEESEQQFIWVVRKGKNEEDDEKWLPEGFEERMEGKGLIIKGWAPQVLILDHESTGGFMTHCGWNSTLEGICAGVPMVTWPAFAEQFFNEKLVTQILRTGVSVGARKWSREAIDGVKSEAVEKAVRKIMVGEEAEEMGSRAKKLKEMARKAVEEGGSSLSNLNDLIEELSALSATK